MKLKINNKDVVVKFNTRFISNINKFYGMEINDPNFGKMNLGLGLVRVQSYIDTGDISVIPYIIYCGAISNNVTLKELFEYTDTLSFDELDNIFKEIKDGFKSSNQVSYSIKQLEKK